MKINLFILISACALFSCTPSENISNGISYHFFRQNGEIGIVDSRGQITCEPKFDGKKYFPTEFDNLKHSKFASIYNDEKNKNLVIDIYGNEPFPNISNIKSHGDLAMYFDDFSGNEGLHILSLTKKEEIGFFKNRVAINFHGTIKYFYSILDNKTWRLYNELGDKIYEKNYRLDIDIIETDDEFEAIVLSRRGTEIKYINSNGKELRPSESLQRKFEQQKEGDSKKEHLQYGYEAIPSSGYSKHANKYKVVEALKYESGEELYIVSEDNRQGVLNSEGEIILEIKYENISSNYKMLFFSKEGKKGMANLNGEIIFKPKFQSIEYEPYNLRYINLKYNEYWFEAEINGKIFKPKHIEI